MRQCLYPHRFKIQFFKTKVSEEPVREESFSILAKTSREAIKGANAFGKRESNEKGYDDYKLEQIIYI